MRGLQKITWSARMNKGKERTSTPLGFPVVPERQINIRSGVSGDLAAYDT